MNSRAIRRSRGFTLIEIMVVISINVILLSVAIPLYSHSVTHAKEDNLRKNLNTLNVMIFRYTLDKQKAPQSLNDLVTANYIKAVPQDITGSVDTWQLDSADGAILSLDQKDGDGIIGVHSGSNQVASDGTQYSTW